jgi:PEP-CTERM motif
MHRTNLLLAACCCLFFTVIAHADPVIVPAPLDSPVFVSLTANPVVQVGDRTVDFTSVLAANQEFIAFQVLPFPEYPGGGVIRYTMGIRARDGLVSLSGVFPQSPDPSFTNTLPVFSMGTTDLILFDWIIAQSGTPFSITLTDLNGNVHTAMFLTAVPEPATIFLLGTGLAGVAAGIKRRRAKQSGEATTR